MSGDKNYQQALLMPLGAKLYILAGYQRDADGTSRLVRTTSGYDPATNAWTTKAPMPDRGRRRHPSG